jgi:DNA-binding IclR family transcriptional regulator
MATPPAASASEKTLRVLAAAVTHRRFADITRATGLAKATTHRILESLTGLGYLVTSADGSYRPGPQLLVLAGAAIDAVDLGVLAGPVVARLVDSAQCTVHVGGVAGDEIVYLLRQDSPVKPYKMPSRVGQTIPMHTSGIGKAVLASLSDAELDAFLARAPLAPRTERSITDAARLREELALIQRRGYATDDEENVPGVVCVAAPVRDMSGRVTRGLSVSTISIDRPLADLETLAPAVIAAARELEAAIGGAE